MKRAVENIVNRPETWEAHLEANRPMSTSDTGGIEEQRVVMLEWTSRLSVGVDEIDDQNKELFDRINGLLKAALQGEGPQKIGEILTFLSDYTVVHFELEEKYMIQYQYSGQQLHQMQHARFADEIGNLRSRHETHGASLPLVTELIRQLVRFVLNHVSEVDRGLGIFLRAKLRKRCGHDDR